MAFTVSALSKKLKDCSLLENRNGRANGVYRSENWVTEAEETSPIWTVPLGSCICWKQSLKAPSLLLLKTVISRRPLESSFIRSAMYLALIAWGLESATVLA